MSAKERIGSENGKTIGKPLHRQTKNNKFNHIKDKRVYDTRQALAYNIIKFYRKILITMSNPLSQNAL